MELYRHSGKISLPGIPLTVVFGAAASSVLGVIYSYINVYDPIVYINALLAAGLGFAIGWAVAYGVRLGKIRNPAVAGAYGLIFGLAGLYFAWVADPWARDGFDRVGLAAFDPAKLEGYMQRFYENGRWAMSSHGGKGETVSGIALGIIWVIEAGTIVGIATVFAYRTASATPFCEACACWTNLESPAAKLLLLPEVQATLTAGNLDGLEAAPGASGDEAMFLQLDVHRCPKCDASNFLTVYEATRKVDKKGKVTYAKKRIVPFLVVASADVPRIRAAGRGPRPETA